MIRISSVCTNDAKIQFNLGLKTHQQTWDLSRDNFQNLKISHCLQPWHTRTNAQWSNQASYCVESRPWSLIPPKPYVPCYQPIKSSICRWHKLLIYDYLNVKNSSPRRACLKAKLWYWNIQVDSQANLLIDKLLHEQVLTIEYQYALFKKISTTAQSLIKFKATWPLESKWISSNWINV
jgi:hypothetical protein